MGGAAGSAKLRISDFADAANAKVNELTSQTRWKLEQVGHRSKRYVQEHPLHVLLAITSIAFAVGPFAWFFAALIVGVAYAILGGVAAYLGIREIRAEGIVPCRTVRVLKQDQIWLENEGRVA